MDPQAHEAFAVLDLIILLHVPKVTSLFPPHRATFIHSFMEIPLIQLLSSISGLGIGPDPGALFPDLYYTPHPMMCTAIQSPTARHLVRIDEV